MEGGDLVWAEIRLKVSEQVRGAVLSRSKDKGEACGQVIWNLLPAEVPKHGAEFIFLVKADPVIDGEKFTSLVFKENVTAFAVGVVNEQVEEGNWF